MAYMKRTILILVIAGLALVFFQSIAKAQNPGKALCSMLPKAFLEAPFKRVTDMALLKSAGTLSISETPIALAISDGIASRAFVGALIGLDGGYTAAEKLTTSATIPVSSLENYLAALRIDATDYAWFSEGMSVEEISAGLNKQISEILIAASNNPQIEEEVLWLGIIEGLLSLPETIIKIQSELSVFSERNFLESFHTSLRIAVNAVDPRNSLIADLNADLAGIFSKGLTKKINAGNPEGVNYFLYNHMLVIASRLERSMVLAHRVVKAADSNRALMMRNEIQADLLAIFQIFEWLGIKQPKFLEIARKEIESNPTAYIEKMALRALVSGDKPIQVRKSVDITSETGVIERITVGSNKF